MQFRIYDKSRIKNHDSRTWKLESRFGNLKIYNKLQLTSSNANGINMVVLYL